MEICSTSKIRNNNKEVNMARFKFRREGKGQRRQHNSIPWALWIFPLVIFLLGAPVFALGASYYEGKTLTIVVVYKPGGLTIGTFNNALATAQLTKVEGVKFDLTKFAWLGSLASDAVIMVIRSDLPYKTVDDMRKAKEIVIGTTGPGSSTHDFPSILKEFTGLNFKLVPGYSSSADVMLALERKEVDGRAGSYELLTPS